MTKRLRQSVYRPLLPESVLNIRDRTLAPEENQFKVLVQRQELTGAECQWASVYEIEEVVRYAHGSKASGIEIESFSEQDEADAEKL